MKSKHTAVNLKREKLFSALTHGQASTKEAAYQIGYAGRRHPAFRTVGEDAEPQDIDRAIQVHIIDRDNEASTTLLDLAILMLKPVLQSYIQGLKDGCRDNENPHLLDMGRQFRCLVASRNG